MYRDPIQLQSAFFLCVSPALPTLMVNLKDRPQHFMLFLSIVRRIFGILHLIAELEQGIFYVFEAVRWRFASARGANRGHFVLEREDTNEVVFALCSSALYII